MSFIAAAPATLLLVDDDCQQLELCARILKRFGFPVLTAGSHREAISITAEHGIDIAVLDYEMPEMNGCMLADQMRALYRDIRIILYSGALEIPRNEMTNVDIFVPKGRGAASLVAPILQLTRVRTVSDVTPLGPCRFLQTAAESY